jgi:hypothetical protein
VCGRNGVPDDRLWYLGCTIRKDMHCKAAIEVPVPAIRKAGLDCLPLPDEYDEHGVIIKWPDEEKDARLSRQQDLAAAHTAVLWPPASPSKKPAPKQDEKRLSGDEDRHGQSLTK